MNRPNEKLDKHLEQYIRAAAIGLGLPYEFVWDTSAIGGVAQRFIIQKAARCFAARQDVLVNAFLSKLWRYAIARAISRRELPMVAGWQQVGWQTPRSITVDVGREATARRDDVKAGLMTLSDYFGEQGIDWKEAVAEIAAEREFAADLGVMIGVEQAQPQEEIIPDIAQPEVVMPAAEFSQLIAKLDCGTGAGGFKPGNDCAKGGKVNSEDDSADNYRGGHKPPNPENGAPLHDLTGSGAFPEDIYGKDAARIYSSADEKLDQQTLKIFRDVKGKPNAELPIYRAVPVNVSDTTINAGDWVSVNLEYAKLHGEGALGGEYKLLKGTARASELYTNADSIQEQGYWPSDSGKMSIVAEEIRFSARARKKKRIYKRKKPEAKPTP